MAQLICQNLTVGYEGKAVMDPISFSLNRGDYLCIIGENGAGKSTLMKTLLKLQPPIAGNVSLGDGLMRNEIGYLPQQTAIQKDFPASVREIVLSGCQSRCRLRPFYNKTEKETAERMMEKLQITDLAGRCYRNLSGGQQQRVLLARALCAAQKLLFLDEPVSGLDPAVTREMYQLIQKLNQEEKITVIMISHDIHTAVSCASHILKLGKQIFYGTRQEYENEFEREKL